MDGVRRVVGREEFLLRGCLPELLVLVNGDGDLDQVAFLRGDWLAQFQVSRVQDLCGNDLHNASSRRFPSNARLGHRLSKAFASVNPKGRPGSVLISFILK